MSDSKKAEADAKKRKRKLHKDVEAALFEDEVIRLASTSEFSVENEETLADVIFEEDHTANFQDFSSGEVLRTLSSSTEETSDPFVRNSSNQEEEPQPISVFFPVEVDVESTLGDVQENLVHPKFAWGCDNFLSFYYSEDEFSDSEFPESAYSDVRNDILETPLSATISSTLENDIVDWSLSHNVTHSALDSLLGILRVHGHDTLPKRATTLLRTPHCTAKFMRDLGSGKFWYNGILNSLKALFRPNMATEEGDRKLIVLDIFVDGLSPYKNPSKKTGLWPIAGRIICDKIKTKPFLVALWCGPKKEPDDLDEFLREFVEESKELMKGFLLDRVSYKLKLRNLIGDAPARAMLKKVSPHNSTISCERCDLRCYRHRNRQVFDPNEVGSLRTDKTFSDRVDDLYHTGTSLLEEIIGMISQFPLDPMHLLYIGAMRRILKMLMEPKASDIKIRPALVDLLNAFLRKISAFIPSEFHGGHRSLSDWRTYKAKENKLVLNYSGILIFWELAKLAPDYKDVNDCFLLLCCASRILSDPNLCKNHVDDADYLLKCFVSYSATVFGEHFVVYNIHNLRHLSEDCKRHGILDNFSAELYESALGVMKKDLRAPGRTLPQIIARTLERQAHDSIKIRENECATTDVQEPCSSQRHYDSSCSDGLRGEMFQKYERAGVRIVVSSCAANNCCCLMKDGEIIVVDNIVKCTDGAIYVVGRQFQEKTPFFLYPFDSSLVGVYKVRDLAKTRFHWNVKHTIKKCVLLPIPDDADENSPLKALEVRDNLAITILHSEFFEELDDSNDEDL